MAKIQDILKRFDIEADKIESITDSINKEYVGEEFVAKKQYHKRIKENDDLKEKVIDLEAKVENPQTDEYKGKYETLEKDFNLFKANIETEKVNGFKSSTLKTLLAKEGVNEKLIPLLLKEFDLRTIELENGEVKGWEEVVKPIKDNYSDFFTVQSTEGNPPLTPPGVGNGGQQGNETDPLALALGKLL